MGTLMARLANDDVHALNNLQQSMQGSRHTNHTATEESNDSLDMHLSAPADPTKHLGPSWTLHEHGADA